ncbi:hypothetical protein [Nocardioides rubriscoriae]|uniref:hypothetical protein n=1 Tax=Nocardioides rubriscoriae TaxID=642762 RepID=UPI0011DF4E60|nr:hypothetical protein [Nocardioides rubriscoriae]
MSQDWTERLFRDEGAPGARVILDAVASPGPDPLELDLNVWIVTVDRAAGTVHVEHSFDPDEGDLSLDDLVTGLGSRLADPS